MRTCPSCGTENPPDSRYCGRCGAALAAACTRCGADLSPGERFCRSCGAPVSPDAPPGEERKLVTVLFADVAGYTGLGERLGDPERLKEVMTAFFDAMREEIEAEGGTVEKFIGDAVMAVFGVPSAHEDDATRALRAAARMRGRLVALNERLDRLHGVTLSIRIGVNTGDVLASATPRPGTGMVAGDAVSVASRLEQAASPGQVLVGERTARASWGVPLREVGPLALKGKERPVLAFELATADDGSGRAAPPPVPPVTEAPRVAEPPMVGRAAELDLLRTLFDRMRLEEHPHLVTIYGEAGIGKTRLVREFETLALASEAAPRSVRGRCLPYGEGVTYWPLGEILKGHAGVLDTDPPGAAVERIRDAVGELLAGRSGLDPGRVAGALSFTLGLEDPEVPLSGEPPARVRAETHAAWRSFASALAAEGPVLVIIEDIHWAVTALLDLIEELAERIEGPALILCTSRPDLSARRPGWGGGRANASGILLDPLGAAEARTLLSMLPGGAELGTPVVARVLERAGGNPFFLEEIARHLAEGSGTVEIPDTVQGVLAARMDLLEPVEKRVVQLAAVVGRIFWLEPVRELLGATAAGDGPELERVLEDLEDRGLVVSRLASSMAGDREFVFRHVLTRDVAYESLPRRERAAAHAVVAAWLGERSGEREREFAELIAHHDGEAHRGAADDPGRAAAEVEDLRGAAVRSALLASEETRRRLVLDRAVRWAERALGLAASPRERARALEALGLAHFQAWDGDLAWTALREAADLLAADPEAADADVARLCASALEVVTRGRGTMRTRLPEREAKPYLEIGLGRPGDAETGVRLLIVRSFWPVSFSDGDRSEEALLEARQAGEQAATTALEMSRPDLASAALDGAGSYYLARDLMGRLGEVLTRRLEIVDRLADPAEAADAYSMAAWSAFQSGRYRDALRYAREGFALAADGSLLMALYCLDWQAVARFRLGEWDGMLEDVQAAEALLGDRRENPPGFASDHLAAAAVVHEIRGRPAEADRLLGVLEWLQEAEDRPSPAWAAWRSLVVARRGRGEEALASLDAATERLSYGRGYLLEARCDVVAEAQRWEAAASVVARAREHAEEAALSALVHYADRLEGRAAAAGGDRSAAVDLLTRAREGFGGLGAAWEEAVTALDLAEALAAAGRSEPAGEALRAGAEVTQRLGSVRESHRAAELAARLGLSLG